MQGDAGQILIQEKLSTIIVDIDVASEKHDYFMSPKETGVVFRASSVAVGNNEL